MKDKRIMSYKHHVIWYNDGAFMVALKRNGTDEYFSSIEDAMNAIDAYEDGRK